MPPTTYWACSNAAVRPKSETKKGLAAKLTTIDAVEQRADAARARNFEATCGDPEWLAVARIQHNIVHCRIQATTSSGGTRSALENHARDLEQNFLAK